MLMAVVHLIWVEWVIKKVRSQKYDVRIRRSEFRKYSPASKEAGFSFTLTSQFETSGYECLVIPKTVNLKHTLK